MYTHILHDEHTVKYNIKKNCDNSHTAFVEKKAQFLFYHIMYEYMGKYLTASPFQKHYVFHNIISYFWKYNSMRFDVRHRHTHTHLYIRSYIVHICVYVKSIYSHSCVRIFFFFHLLTECVRHTFTGGADSKYEAHLYVGVRCGDTTRSISSTTARQCY